MLQAIGLLTTVASIFVLGMGQQPFNRVKEEPAPPRPPSKRPHHDGLLSSVEVKPSWKGRISATVHRIRLHEKEYKKASSRTGVPWQIIAALHNMESTGSFSKHLHEGSSLRGRTRWVPKGRPKTGKPPFSWQESAYDALYTLKRMDRFDWSDWGESLYQCERYNGLGYLKYRKHVNSPYLWSGTWHYDKGKYVADGKWSNTARSSQVGVVPILLELDYFNQ
jgi:lysozyme family protein|tara:strand:- start:9920 stop:10585 length:666 start_codon:yes stop_codon:yes gene_type:complete